MTRTRPPFSVTSTVAPSVWRSLAASDPAAVLSQSLEWADCVRSDGRYDDVSRLYQFDDGDRILVPLARRRGLPRCCASIGSWPGVWGVGGPLIENGRMHEENATAVLDDLAEQRALTLRIQMRDGEGAAWLRSRRYRATPYSSAVIDLDGGFKTVWQQRFTSGARRSVLRAERSRLEVRSDNGGALLPPFNYLFEQSIRRWSAQQREPLVLTRWRTRRQTAESMLEIISHRFGERFKIWIASVDGRPAASIIVIGSGAYAKYWRGAMDKDLAAPVRANELLHRLAIEEACDLGYRYYEMGESRDGSPLEQFKRKLGAETRRGYTLRSERVPLSKLNTATRTLVKRAIGFVDS